MSVALFLADGISVSNYETYHTGVPIQLGSRFHKGSAGFCNGDRTGGVSGWINGISSVEASWRLAEEFDGIARGITPRDFARRDLAGFRRFAVSGYAVEHGGPLFLMPTQDFACRSFLATIDLAVNSFLDMCGVQCAVMSPTLGLVRYPGLLAPIPLSDYEHFRTTTFEPGDFIPFTTADELTSGVLRITERVATNQFQTIGYAVDSADGLRIGAELLSRCHFIDQRTTVALETSFGSISGISNIEIMT